MKKMFARILRWFWFDGLADKLDPPQPTGGGGPKPEK